MPGEVTETGWFSVGSLRLLPFAPLQAAGPTLQRGTRLGGGSQGLARAPGCAVPTGGGVPPGRAFSGGCVMGSVGPRVPADVGEPGELLARQSRMIVF